MSPLISSRDRPGMYKEFWLDRVLLITSWLHGFNPFSRRWIDETWKIKLKHTDVNNRQTHPWTPCQRRFFKLDNIERVAGSCPCSAWWNNFNLQRFVHLLGCSCSVTTSPLLNMAGSNSLPTRHFELEQCVNFLGSRNSVAQLEHPAVSRYKTLVTSGPDTELLRFQSSLRGHDVKKILIYLRNFDICDLPDCERISNPHLFPTSELMVTELVTMISTKDPHAFWYFVHAVKKFRGRKGLFEFFHGNINCCGEFLINSILISTYRPCRARFWQRN